ncbi:putative metal-dependent phosphoesterase TrpH [Christiangramia gaetbulicola]|uniref:Putative metal-dependent phosphoesterase TrpH n=1 Tax=Christiangramia gaetbulicola TaxID=703340 RepID=A0A2T6AK92_9FLAO|nr:histidinol-phosphatase [Christiangramia gaetbulicola]PTX44252.1 putative metal-dependent phosphoesterase TrpH [Christiangramia gaetbulicola]
MRKILIIAILMFSLFCGSTLYAQESKWYKGNLHTHSYWSDGDEFPEMIMQWYKDREYQFVALSDHNIIAEGIKAIKVPNEPLYLKAFEEYLEKYGEDWMNYRRLEDGVQVQLKTLEEFRPLFEEQEKFMIFKAEEVTSYLDNKAIHMGAINIDTVIKPRKGNTVVELIQNNLNAIREHGEENGKTVLQHLNHPNFTYAITANDIKQIDGERFFEVFNGHPYVNNYGDSIHDSTEQMWDQVNIAYHAMNKPLLLGIATDDSHHYHKFGSKWSNAGRGWVEVRAKELEPESILKAMYAGDFYASTGVELSELNFNGTQLSIAVKDSKNVNYEIQFIGVKKGATESEVLKSVNGSQATFEIPEDVLFVRAKIISDKLKKNPYQEGDVEVAWTQPVTRK